MLQEDPIESVVLRESIRARISVAPVSLAVVFASIFFYIPVLILQGVPSARIACWAIPIIVLMLARGRLSRRINADLDSLAPAELVRADRKLRASSVVNQLTMGLGIWIVCWPRPDSVAVPLFMTLIVVLWSIGVMANLFSDFRSFMISVPLMIFVNALFWTTQGEIGLSIALTMLFSALFMVILARRGTQVFREAITMRFEKDNLLEKLEAERESTLRALRDAQAANESKAFFLAAASHDIKQPLHALALLTDTLLMSDPAPSIIPVLRHQRDSITQMSAHFDTLMDLGRFEGGHFELTLSQFRLGTFAPRVDVEFGPLCADKGLAWTLDLEDVLVSCDQELLLRMLRNLLQNAVRFTAAGEVRCEARSRGALVEFAVSDTGCGIAREYHAEVFREFVKIDNDGVRSAGAGLGLSIVSKINQALELDLQMSSIVGQGTQFTFRLPLAYTTQAEGVKQSVSPGISESPALGC